MHDLARERAGDAFDALDALLEGAGHVVHRRTADLDDHVVGPDDGVGGLDAGEACDGGDDGRGLAHLGLDQHVRADAHPTVPLARVWHESIPRAAGDDARTPLSATPWPPPGAGAARRARRGGPLAPDRRTSRRTPRSGEPRRPTPADRPGAARRGRPAGP